ncbi:outer membrane beta-barrel protein [Polluticoccus soli]|uniref:outer membrane beta-barrel protein n=1 Tax=Polluticoccus soli TaxID=3034150 RepID=UPI0023E1A15D|nr:outer membrane beta-barrel protein [Flavipsychrobacter sp. JY13-12]
MKRTLAMLLMCAAATSHAQQLEPTGRYYAGINFKYGQMKERMTIAPAVSIYPNVVNYDRTPTNTEKGKAFGFDAQLGYFFSTDKKWGVGTGLVYLKSEGAVSIDATHFEYQSTDFKGDVFRQVITSTAPIREELEVTNMSIPLVVKYRTPICDKFGFNVDAGLVYNVRMETSYTGTAAYNYEAIYKFDNTGNVAVYDNSPVPDPKDWLMTVQNYNEHRSDGNVNDYFQKLQDQGYNVGLGEAAGKSGKVEHRNNTTIGVLLQPSFSYKLTEAFSINVGGYYMFQKFRKEDSRISRMTDKLNEYNSLLDNASRRRQYNTGLTVGLSLCF